MSYKQGIDFFPFQLDLIEDRKFRRLRIQYGAVSVLVYLSLLCMIFRDKGYYLDYNEKTRTDVIWEVLNDLRGKDAPPEETIHNIIVGLAEAELFDPELFRAGKLTSRRIQTVYYRITCGRKEIKVDFSIWVLEEAEMRAISGRSSILATYLANGDQSKKQENRSVLEENQSLLQQRKEKERTEKKSKEEKEASATAKPTTPSAKKAFGSFGHVRLKETEREELNRQYGQQTVEKAMQLLDEYMEMTGKRYQNCALAIRRWGIAAVRERAAGKGGKPLAAKPNAFCNFKQDSLDYNALTEVLRGKAIEKKEEIT